MFVIKASGKREKFQRKKIFKTCLKAGASKKLAEKITKEIEKKAYNGITTKEILRMILEFLDKHSPKTAAKYDLKGAIMRLGPAGYVFEHLVAELLREYGYKTEWHKIIKGFCVEHEIDVLAEISGKRYMIECKYHNSPGIYTGIKEVLYTYARFLDLREGEKAGKSPKFDNVWLISNTKFSSEAIKYGLCKNIKLIGWNYPKQGSLKNMLERKKLYPITVLRKLDRVSQNKLAKAGLMFCRDLLKKDIKELIRLTGLSKRKLKDLIEEAENILGNTNES